jgi:ABC-type nickel/cobalt efflux system permease component RcnA
MTRFDVHMLTSIDTFVSIGAIVAVLFSCSCRRTNNRKSDIAQRLSQVRFDVVVGYFAVYKHNLFVPLRRRIDYDNDNDDDETQSETNDARHERLERADRRTRNAVNDNHYHHHHHHHHNNNNNNNSSSNYDDVDIGDRGGGGARSRNEIVNDVRLARAESRDSYWRCCCRR